MGSRGAGDAAEVVFVSWAQDCSRSDGIARGLGGPSFMIYSPRWGSRYATILFKYLSQSTKTLSLLWRLRPRVVFVMTPPVFACLPVWLYALLRRGVFVIDAHSGAFLDPRWSGLLFLHEFFSRRAAATIVTNEHLKALVSGWNAPTVIVTDVPMEQPPQPSSKPPGAPSVMTMACTFAVDEPIAEFFEAARLLPDVTFHVTGNFKKYDPAVLERRPPNVRLTGFISRADYLKLVQGSDAVIALTTLDHTMQRAAYEAIYLGRPVVTSNFALLRQEFPLGTVHVDNTVESIREGIQRMRDSLPSYQAAALQLREQKMVRWVSARQKLQALTGLDVV